MDLYSAFGTTINSFRSRCAHISTEMWRYSISQVGVEIEEGIHVLCRDYRRISLTTVTGLEPKDLRAWLAPQDHILATIASDHMTLANAREEYTCLWAEPYLTNFGASNIVILPRS